MTDNTANIVGDFLRWEAYCVGVQWTRHPGKSNIRKDHVTMTPELKAAWREFYADGGFRQRKRKDAGKARSFTSTGSPDSSTEETQNTAKTPILLS